jgi:membrane protease YdiL (CAAX protease family)
VQTCYLHPFAEAAGACEYCGQPHCSSCLDTFLGRRYCPPCLDRVRVFAQQPAPAQPAGPGSPTAPTTPARPANATLPGIWSAAVYLVGLVLVLMLFSQLLGVGMVVARSIAGRVVPDRGAIVDTTGLGLPLWSAILAGWAWLQLVAVLALTAVLAHSLERRTVGSFGLQPRYSTFWRDALVGPGLAAVLFISVVGIGAGKGWYAVYSRMTAIDALGVTLTSLLILVPMAVLEEVAVRGYLLQTLNRSVGRWGAVLVSSALFALLHAANEHANQHPLAILGIFLAGVYLGSAYLITGNLWLPIFIHIGWNLMEGPIFGLPVSGNPMPISILQTSDTGPQFWTGGPFGPEGGMLLCLLMGVHLAALWAMRPVLSGKPGSNGEADTPVVRPLNRVMPPA